MVGGGQTGTTFAFALRRAGIGRVSVIDAAPDETQAGIWLTRARMQKLRTPKGIPGPELGITALGFQAWYEARHGREPTTPSTASRAPIGRPISNGTRDFLAIPVRYGTRLLRVEPVEGHFRLHLDIGRAEPAVETARTLIFGNGRRR